MSDFEREYQTDPDDEREVDLEKEGGEPVAPPTIDPDERVEAEEDTDIPIDDERPV
ncbi:MULTISPECIES: hypothetical protein [unclassified Diaminobutyricimonas]|uniref:hypothetical protein n=1 Tax=unclassified Diaminobutyricimonas TaxID=2643261 RepID=UPI0012F481C2|nr:MULTISPECIES: hypothetical protein [unclassified Diaminobutyricimonas]